MRAMDMDRFRSTLINLVDIAGDCSAVVAAAKKRELDAFDFVTGGRFNLAAAFRLARWAKGNGVIIIHGHGFKSDLVGLLAARIAGCRMMTTPHGWSLEKDRKLLLYEQMDRFSFRFMDIICPLSKALLTTIDRSCKNVKLILNGVDIDEVQSAPVIRNFDDNLFLVGYVGRLIESKDIETLLQAVKHLVELGRKVALELVGDGDRREALQDLALSLGIADRVRFAGFQIDAASFLKGFNCFVLPSLSEGIPRCIMEAMALNIPVVGSDIPGNRNLISDRETGLLFPVSDSNALFERIAWVMDHPAETTAMAARGRQKVEREYSNRKMAKEYSAVYEDLVAGSR